MQNNKALVRIVTWFLIFICGRQTITRLITKWSASKRWHLDDFFALVTLLLSTGTAVAVSFAAEHGLAAPLTNAITASPNAFIFEKSLFASEILFIAAILCSKLNNIELLRILFAYPEAAKVSTAFSILLTVATVVSIFTVSFQCRIPLTWDLSTHKCISLVAFWRYQLILNVLSDIGIIVLPIVFIRNIQMRRSKKIVVVSCFLPWILDITANLVPLAFISAFSLANPRPNATLWPWFLCTQVIQTTSILAGSVPYLRQFLEALPSGMLKSSDITRRGDLTYREFSAGRTALESIGRGYSLRQTNLREENAQGGSVSSPGQAYRADLEGRRAPYSRASAVVVERGNGDREPRGADGMAINVMRSIDVRSDVIL